MNILAIDPGRTESAWLCYSDGEIVSFGKTDNESLLEMVQNTGVFDPCEHLAIEMVASYGMPVGKDVFETCVWIGRFIQGGSHLRPAFIYRKDVKMHLCGSMKAKDANIRQALIDRFGAPGTKANPGATYGISTDVWSALAVAVTYADKEALQDKGKAFHPARVEGILLIQEQNNA